MTILNRAHHISMVCTKLVQWLTLAGVFFCAWTTLVVDILPIEISKEMHQVILIVSPSAASLCHFGR